MKSTLILLLLVFLTNVLFAQHHAYESPLVLVNELKKIQKNWKDNPDYYKNPNFQFVIDLSVNQEDSKNYKKHKIKYWCPKYNYNIQRWSPTWKV